MQWSGWRRWAAIVLLLCGILGCTLPSSSQTPPLTAAAAKHTLDSWNSGFCKVADFYGFYISGQNPANQEAFVLIANPNPQENDVVIKYMTPQGVEPGSPLTIPPWSRVTVDVNSEMPGTDVSVEVTGNYPIVAERAMYWNNRGGGTDSIGYMTDEPY